MFKNDDVSRNSVGQPVVESHLIDVGKAERMALDKGPIDQLAAFGNVVADAAIDSLHKPFKEGIIFFCLFDVVLRLGFALPESGIRLPTNGNRSSELGKHLAALGIQGLSFPIGRHNDGSRVPRIVLPRTLFVLDVLSGEGLDFQNGTNINSCLLYTSDAADD